MPSLPTLAFPVELGRQLLRKLLADPASWAELGTVDGRVAILVRDSPAEPPSYRLFLRLRNRRIQAIRDYRYVRHVFAEAEWTAGEAS